MYTQDIHTKDYTLQPSTYLQKDSTPSLSAQNQADRDNTDKTSTTDYRTSTTTHKMEHRLHTELNGKTHKLPITKEYILKEYHDVFKGVGTLPGGPYHIRLKEQYRPVQHPPRSVPIAMQTGYKSELDRLTKEGIITEVKEYTEWINLIVPVMKPNGSLRLCLDRKDLNKEIERNQWYSRTIDDILPELAKSKFKTLKDATSGYWHVVLNLASSLLTMFNTPWGKCRWLRLPFGLKIASDVSSGMTGQSAQTT